MTSYYYILKNTFAVAFEGRGGCAVVHGMNGEVDLWDGLLVLQVAQGGMSLGLSCRGRGHAVCQVVWVVGAIVVEVVAVVVC